MPDPVTAEAARSFLEYGVVGALCLLLMVVIIFQHRTHKAELKEERDAHQRTREAQIIEIRQFATLGESIRDQQKALEVTITAVLDLVKERDRR
jgi:hypothetical protein